MNDKLKCGNHGYGVFCIGCAPWIVKEIDKRRKRIMEPNLDNLEQMVKNDSDMVNSPSHYNSGKIEVIDAIEDWKLGFSLGNAVKYLARAGKKNTDKYVEDLKKAIWYIEREISNHE